MPSKPAPIRPSAPTMLTTPQVAHARVALGRFAAEAEVAVTPAGLLAVGGLVSMILLSVAPIIVSARAGRRTNKPDQPAQP